MRILLLYNPSAGRGQGEVVAQAARVRLEADAHCVEMFSTAAPTGSGLVALWHKPLQDQDLLVVAGGDGTLHSVLPRVLSCRLPICHLALGTENLFAREFGMSRSVDTLAAAVQGGKIVEVDAAALTLDDGQAPLTHYFLLMCSIGPDAGVIRRLDAARRGPITHWSYFRPILSELLTGRIPLLTIEADGRLLVTDTPGMAIIANCRQYAWRIDPCRGACMTDGLLDITFLPAPTRWSLAAGVLRSRFRRSHGPAAITARAREVRVSCPPGTPHPAYQLDGECGRHPFPNGFDLRVRVLPRAVRVLAAPGSTMP